MVLDSHLTISLLHLLIGCVRLDLEDAVVAVVVWTELSEDGIHLSLRQADVSCDGLKDIDLPLMQTGPEGS